MGDLFMSIVVMINGGWHHLLILDQLCTCENVYLRIFMVFITVIFLQLIANHRHRIILNIKDIDKPLEDDVDFKVDSYCIQHQIYIGSIEIYYFKY